MNRATTIMIALAALTILGAVWMAPHALPPAAFEDTGEPLFAAFTDPNEATSLEVIEWDADDAAVKRFKVEQKQGRWVIPSHHDYPADGSEHMGRAAASFIDVKRDMYYGDKADEHASFGVLDPEDREAGEGARGKRIIMRDASGGTLVDIIVGHAIPDKDGFSYVRFPEQKRVYGSRLDLSISTAFTEWIEKDLMLLEPSEVVSLVYDPYRVDESRGQVVDTNPLHAERPVSSDAGAGAAGGNDWRLAASSKAPAGKELDSFKVQQVLDAIDGLQIVGVRPRPEPLTLAALQSKGFFVTADGSRLFGNEGEVRATTKDGVVYTLYFGEITLDSGLALTAGTDQGASAPAKDPAKESEANRYLFVDVAYDPASDRTAAAASAKAEAAAAAPAEAKADAGAEVEPSTNPADASAGVTAEHREQVAKLQKRFDAWFYVISDASFKRIHKPRDEYFKAPPAKAAP
jgi:hypothetical protein